MRSATQRPGTLRRKTLAVAVSAAALGMTTAAHAFEFATESGWSGNVTTTVSASSSWRAEEQDNDLVAATNLRILSGAFNPVTGAPTVTTNPVPGVGGANGIRLGSAVLGGDSQGQTDGGNLNYDRNDNYSRMLKFLTEVKVAKGDMGGMIRLKGWYDDALNNEHVRWGSPSTGYGSGRSDKALSDDGLDDLNRFDGIFLMDAFVYNTFDVANMPMQVRVGRQALNWGESLFVQGVNQISPLDITALRRAGTEIKEALLPIWSISANLGLPGGMSLEGFYQFKWEPSVIDQCSTYWSPAEGSIGVHAGECNKASYISNGSIASINADLFVAGVKGEEADDGGQWGLSFKFPVEAIDTEVGVYYMNIHARTPIVSAKSNAAAACGVIGGTGVTAGLPNFAVSPLASASCQAAQIAQSGSRFQYNSFWEYPEDIKIAGLSAATTLAGWSVAAELSHQMDVPVQSNSPDGVSANLTYTGITGAADPRSKAELLEFYSAVGNVRHGYELFDKTQFQVNGVALLPQILGASSGQFVGEIAFQWNNVPESSGELGQKRFGRGFVFGAGAFANPGQTVNAAETAACGNLNNSQQGCKNDGYVTDNAWGYRLRASLDYSSVFDTSWNVTPSIFWAQDVEGYSMDSQFLEDRQTLSLGLRFGLNRVHNIDLNYTTYSNGADYDIYRDRDNYSIAYNYTF